MSLGNDGRSHRNSVRIAQLRETQRQLLRDIQERYGELGMAVDRLRSYLNDDDEQNQSTSGCELRNKCKKQKLEPNKDKLIKERILPTTDTVIYLRDRECGTLRHGKAAQIHRAFLNTRLPDFVSQHLPATLAEKQFHLGTINKVFASKWLNDDQVVLGTKCNKLMVMDVRNNSLVEIQTLKSSEESQPAECPCGIHSIAINPSRTMLATGADNTNDLAVYELPTFDALCVGEQAHKDWIFDMEWVDDEFIVTGSRDSSVALWCINYQGLSSGDEGRPHLLGHRLIKPCILKQCRDAVRVRALALGRNKKMMGVLSMNAKFHFFDVQTFHQIRTVELHWKQENVCVANSDDYGLFAVGSQAYVTLLDHRSSLKEAKHWVQIPSKNGERGVRSVGFNNNVITVGTGDGRVMFYDIRNSSFLEKPGSTRCELQVGKGWLRDDDNYREHFIQGHYPNAIYTHCYDDWKARLFVAGGPLPTGLYGNYAGLFY